MPKRNAGATRRQSTRVTGNQTRPLASRKSANEPTPDELGRAGLTPLEAMAQIRCEMWSHFDEGAPPVVVTEGGEIEATLLLIEGFAARQEGLNPLDAQARAERVTAGLMAAYRSGKAKIKDAMAPRRAAMLKTLLSTWENMTGEQRAGAPQVAQIIERMNRAGQPAPKTEAEKMQGET